jgi:hypothetical protein
VGLNAHERSRDALSGQFFRAKKWPLRRAAKFREETPRKGGGLAIKDRDTALQQYEGTRFCLQAKSRRIPDQNAAETLIKYGSSASIFRNCRRL